MRKSIADPLGVAAAGVVSLGYAAAGVEVNLYRVRRFELPVLDPGAKPLRILQVSDIHMVPGQRRKHNWLRSLADLEPDLVVKHAGDNLSHPDAIGNVLDALEPLLHVPGVFVFGSNDYYQAEEAQPDEVPEGKGDRLHAPRRERAQNGWQELQAGLEKHGWVGVNNARAAVDLPTGGKGTGLGEGQGRSEPGPGARPGEWPSSARTTCTCSATGTNSWPAAPTWTPRSPSASPMPRTCARWMPWRPTACR